jgi:hypothetical protein
MPCTWIVQRFFRADFGFLPNCPVFDRTLFLAALPERQGVFEPGAKTPPATPGMLSWMSKGLTFKETTMNTFGNSDTPKNSLSDLSYDLGTFEGFNFGHQSAIEYELTAAQVLAWDHDKNGEAEFWPSGDKPEVSLVFKDQSSVTGTELQELDSLLAALGGDSIENYRGFITTFMFWVLGILKNQKSGSRTAPSIFI